MLCSAQRTRCGLPRFVSMAHKTGPLLPSRTSARVAAKHFATKVTEIDTQGGRPCAPSVAGLPLEVCFACPRLPDLAKPYIANAQAKTAVCWINQGFIPQED